MNAISSVSMRAILIPGPTFILSCPSPVLRPCCGRGALRRDLRLDLSAGYFNAPSRRARILAIC